jgi:hypothetical protein
MQQPVAWRRRRFRKSVRQHTQGRFRASWRGQDQETAQAATLRLSQAGRFAAATGVQRRDDTRTPGAEGERVPKENEFARELEILRAFAAEYDKARSARKD